MSRVVIKGYGNITISYNPDTGEMRNHYTGTLFSNSRLSSYIIFRVSKNKVFYVHREAYELGTGTKIPEGYEVDHIDLNKQNNKVENLRLVTRSQNMINRPCFKNNSLREKGISYEPEKRLYRVRLSLKGKRYYFGRYKLLEDAVSARNKALESLHGEYKCQES